MRDIKYRAWCIHKNAWERDRVVLDADGALWHSPIERNKIKLRPDEHIVEFFTGLRDKSGREIYEGDIVQTFLFGKKVVGVIKYSDRWGSFYFATKNDYGVGIAFKDVFEWCYDDEGEILSEIIGNIHENPELKEEI